MNQLPKAITDRIEKEADARFSTTHEVGAVTRDKLYSYRAIYAEALYAEALRAQPLLEALELISDGAEPYNQREMISWIETARKISNEAIKNYNQ